MKIILLQDIKGVGKKFEEKDVADGYALNMLIPKKLAMPATGPSIGMAKQLKEQQEKRRAEEAKRLEEKQARRLEKHQELEEFKLRQRSSPSSS